MTNPREGRQLQGKIPWQKIVLLCSEFFSLDHDGKQLQFQTAEETQMYLPLSDRQLELTKYQVYFLNSLQQ